MAITPFRPEIGLKKNPVFNRKYQVGKRAEKICAVI